LTAATCSIRPGSIHSKVEVRDKLIGSFLGILWIWIGAVYHIGFFSAINPVARVFGALFILEGFFILYSTFSNKLHFSFNYTKPDYLGYFFILFGWIIYPLIGLLIHIEPAKTISLGLPCPTTIFTFGLFILARNQFPKYLIVIPSLWSLLGLFAALNFGVYQDLMLIVSAIGALVIIYARKKNILKYESYV
jgi:hypothetical protein